jgi:hypothetical protein
VEDGEVGEAPGRRRRGGVVSTTVPHGRTKVPGSWTGGPAGAALPCLILPACAPPAARHVTGPERAPSDYIYSLRDPRPRSLKSSSFASLPSRLSLSLSLSLSLVPACAASHGSGSHAPHQWRRQQAAVFYCGTPPDLSTALLLE